MTTLTHTVRRERGFSLVELMVGMAIGLIGITIITHLYLTNEKYKRSTTGSGTAQVNGAIALYTLERDIRGSGFGINHSAALACTCAGAGCSPIRYYYNGVHSFPPAGGVTSLPALMPAPVVITSTAGTPDTITVLSSTDNEGAIPNALTGNMTAGAVLTIDGTAGYVLPGGPAGPDQWNTPNGNFVLVAQAGICMLTRVTDVGATTLVHADTSLWNPAGGGMLPTYSPGANVFNLGITPLWRTYSVLTTANAYKLQVADVLRVIDGSGAAMQIVDDIVDVQAEYGRDANNDGAVAATEWTATPPANAVEWQQVLAVRVAVLARSGNYERPDPPGGACAATTATPTWAGSIDPVTLAVKPGSAFTVPGGLPSCYKHRVFETVVPLRNMIWRPA